MDLNDFFQRILFSNESFTISLGNVLGAAILLVGYLLIHWLLVRRWLPTFLERIGKTAPQRKRIYRRFLFSAITFILYVLIAFSGYEFDQLRYDVETERGGIHLRIDSVVLCLWIIQLARLMTMVFIELFAWGPKPEKPKSPITLHHRPVRDRTRAAKLAFKWFVYTLTALIVFGILDISYEIYTFDLAKRDDNGDPITFSITLNKILETLLIIYIARLIAWLGIRYLLSRSYQKRDINVGSQFAINQLFTYLMYFIALLVVLNILGVNISLVVGGAAALLLGVGLGLQQTFNDFFSGILLLFERSVEVGDVVDVEGLNGTVKRIGLRTSEVQTRENMTVIVPNSKIVVNSVTNWSHNDEIARFHVGVGVAYGSDTELVKDLLLEAVVDHKKVLKFPSPFVRFVNFGNSSLDFEIHFWTKEFLAIEDVKSDIRFRIDQFFRDKGVTIPFPQTDLWIKEWPGRDPGDSGAKET